MDNRINTVSTPSTINPVFFTVSDPISWVPPRATGFRMIAIEPFDDGLEEDDWIEEEDDLEEDEDEWEDDDDDDVVDDDDDDDDDDDFDDDDDDDDVVDDEEADDLDDFEYSYRGDSGVDDADDFDDDISLLGARFSAGLHDPSSEPRRFRDRDGSPLGDNRPKKPRSPRVTHRRSDEIENDTD